MLGREHAAPALAEQVIAAGDAEMREQVVEFIDEQLHLPEFLPRVAQVRRTADAQLVVVDDGPAGVGESGETVEVVVRRARSAMQRHQRRLAGSRSPVTRYQVCQPRNSAVPSRVG